MEQRLSNKRYVRENVRIFTLGGRRWGWYILRYTSDDDDGDDDDDDDDDSLKVRNDFFPWIN